MLPVRGALALTWNYARRYWSVSRERRLGRGLEALLGRSFEAPTGAAPVAAYEQEPASEPPMLALSRADASEVTHSADGQQWLPLSSVTANPYQPRTHFDEAEIADLCDSIRTHGFLQPILVRRADFGYQVIAGERRLRAAQMAGW